jgi:hypothetical protein
MAALGPGWGRAPAMVGSSERRWLASLGKKLGRREIEKRGKKVPTDMWVLHAILFSVQILGNQFG